MIIFFSRLVLPLDGFRKSQLRLTSWLGNCAGESCSHLFFSCSMARNITTKLARWWEFDCPDLFSYDDWLEWFHTLRLLKGFKDILEGQTLAHMQSRVWTKQICMSEENKVLQAQLLMDHEKELSNLRSSASARNMCSLKMHSYLHDEHWPSHAFSMSGWGRCCVCMEPAADRTRLALKAFTDQKRMFFLHLDEDYGDEPIEKKHRGI
ncbi:hypothetical protein Tco_1562040 [Tanacetum coccineum]